MNSRKKLISYVPRVYQFFKLTRTCLNCIHRSKLSLCLTGTEHMKNAMQPKSNINAWDFREFVKMKKKKIKTRGVSASSYQNHIYKLHREQYIFESLHSQSDHLTMKLISRTENIHQKFKNNII